jgi:hypothetical protein
MPYAPGIENIAGQIWSQNVLAGVRALGGSIEDWAKKHDETQQKLETADLLKQYADKKGFTTPEFQAKYAAASAEQKSRMAQGLSQTIVLQAHDAEQKAEQAFRQQQLAQAWEIANLPARVAPVQPGTEPGTIVTNPQDPSEVWGQYGAHGQFIPRTKPAAGEDKTMFHQPGEFVYGPDGKPIGQYTGSRGENIKYFSEMDPLKKAAAEAIEAYKEQEKTNAAGSAASGGGFWNTLIYGRPGSIANPTPSPMPSAAPAVTPGPVIAPVATPTYAPVAPQGATVSPAPRQLDQQTATAFLQQAGGDPEKARQLARAAGYTF